MDHMSIVDHLRERIDQTHGQQSRPVLVALALTHDDLQSFQIHVLHPKRTRLTEPQSRYGFGFAASSDASGLASYRLVTIRTGLKMPPSIAVSCTRNANRFAAP